MTSPAKNAAAALGIHLVAFVLMMTVFKMNVYALVGGNIVFALAMSILNLLKIRKVSGFKSICKHFRKTIRCSSSDGHCNFRRIQTV